MILQFEFVVKRKKMVTELHNKKTGIAQDVSKPFLM